MRLDQRQRSPRRHLNVVTRGHHQIRPTSPHRDNHQRLVDCDVGPDLNAKTICHERRIERHDRFVRQRLIRLHRTADRRNLQPRDGWQPRQIRSHPPVHEHRAINVQPGKNPKRRFQFRRTNLQARIQCRFSNVTQRISEVGILPGFNAPMRQAELIKPSHRRLARIEISRPGRQPVCDHRKMICERLFRFALHDFNSR